MTHFGRKDCMTHEKDQFEQWQRLTEKQKACLDLLLLRKTSKEIARLLDISKPTVDQRMTSARITLGAPNRAQTAIIYQQLKQTYDRVTYDPARLPGGAADMPSDQSNGDDKPEAASGPEEAGFAPPAYSSMFRDIRRRDHSILGRTVIMISMLATLVIVLLAGLGIAQSLTRLISG